MKILFGLLLLFLFMVNPSKADSVNCSSYMIAKNYSYKCTYVDLKSLLKKYRKLGPNKYNKENMFTEFIPDDVKMPKTVTYSDVIKLIKTRMKEKKKSIEDNCDVLASKANNSWSASKLYRKCVKDELNK